MKKLILTLGMVFAFCVGAHAQILRGSGLIPGHGAKVLNSQTLSDGGVWYYLDTTGVSSRDTSFIAFINDSLRTILGTGGGGLSNAVTSASVIPAGAIVVGSGGARGVAGTQDIGIISGGGVAGDTIISLGDGRIIFGTNAYGTSAIFNNGGIYTDAIYPSNTNTTDSVTIHSQIVSVGKIWANNGLAVTGTGDFSTAVTTDLINSHTANHTIQYNNATYTTSDIYANTFGGTISRNGSIASDTAGGVLINPTITITAINDAVNARYRALTLMPNVTLNDSATFTTFRINPQRTARAAGATLNIATWCYNNGTESGSIDSTGKFRIRHQLGSTTDSAFVIDNELGAAKFLLMLKQNNVVKASFDSSGNLACGTIGSGDVSATKFSVSGATGHTLNYTGANAAAPTNVTIGVTAPDAWIIIRSNNQDYKIAGWIDH